MCFRYPVSLYGINENNYVEIALCKESQKYELKTLFLNSKPCIVQKIAYNEKPFGDTPYPELTDESSHFIINEDTILSFLRGIKEIYQSKVDSLTIDKYKQSVDEEREYWDIDENSQPESFKSWKESQIKGIREVYYNINELDITDSLLNFKDESGNYVDKTINDEIKERFNRQWNQGYDTIDYNLIDLKISCGDDNQYAQNRGIDTCKIKIKHNNQTYTLDNAAYSYIWFNVVQKKLKSAEDESKKDFQGIEYLPCNMLNQRRGIIAENIDERLNYLLSKLSKLNSNYVADSFVLKYLKVFEIGTNLEVKKYDDTIYKIYVHNGDSEILLADLGLGYTHLATILLKINIIAKSNNEEGKYKPQTLIIEEPESHLHPALQSKLADMFAEAYEKFNIQFVIETHSEYLIRKLQYKIAEGSFRPEDAVVYYLNNVSENAKAPVKKITFEQDGSLSSNFGSGFFDEADNIAIDIFNLKNRQKKDNHV